MNGKGNKLSKKGILNKNMITPKASEKQKSNIQNKNISEISN